jgi:hypothetical protein
MANGERPLIRSRLNVALQRRLVQAVQVEARRLRAETIRDLLRQAPGFIYRSVITAAKIVRRIIQGMMQRSGDRAGASIDF